MQSLEKIIRARAALKNTEAVLEVLVGQLPWAIVSAAQEVEAKMKMEFFAGHISTSDVLSL